MPSSQQHSPTVKAKSSRNIFFPKKLAGIVNSSSSKMMGSKICTSKNRNNPSNQNESSDSSGTSTNNESNLANSKSENNLTENNDGSSDNSVGDNNFNNNNNNNNNNTFIRNIQSNSSTNSDGNNNNLTFEPVHLQSEQQVSSNENNNFNLGNNNSFTTESRITNESCSTTSSEEASSFIKSSSSHMQTLHRQITRTSETKTSCVSDLSEMRSSLSEIKNICFGNTKFQESIENILDSKDTTGMDISRCNSNVSGEPVITYPESPTPTSSTANIMCFPNEATNFRKNSVTIDDLSYHSPTGIPNELNFVKRKLITSGRNASNEFSYQKQMQANKAISEKSLDTRREQRIITSGDLTREQNQNVSMATVKQQADSFAEKMQKVSAAQQVQTLIISKGFSSSSLMEQSDKDFIKNEINHVTNLVKQESLSEYLMESFDDLNKLRINANQQDVEKAINKYSKNLEKIVETLNDSKSYSKTSVVLDKLSEMMSKAWLVPTHGHELGNSLCDVLRNCGGLDLLISNCDSKDDAVKFSSLKLLEQCLTTDNRDHVVKNGLEKVVHVACMCSKNTDVERSRVSTGILGHLFKHSEGTCENVIKMGGLDAVLFECRKNDLETLRHCASALANLSLYGGAENQEAMIKRKVPMWLFPLAFHNDDNIKYYACLAIAVLVANKEIEAEVLKSGTLNLVEPFVTSHNPFEFAKSNLSHAHGQSQNWLKRLVPVLSSKREEARNLAAFHFCMEAGIKKSQGKTKVFEDIGAIQCLRNVASSPNAIASKFAAQTLRLMGEEVPHKLIQQVPLWSVEDVKQWVIQVGFAEYGENFGESRVDGDLLLRLTEDNLKDDIGIKNGIRRTRFTRELQTLKKMADYTSRDVDNLNGFLQNIGPEFTVYTYSMLNAGIDKDYLKSLSEDQLLHECGIVNSIHRFKILEAIKNESSFANTFQQDLEKPLDVFISYRRSNGSQLASLLKVHLQVRNFSVFIDIEKLEAGKFDNNLLQSIKQASNFILVLTPAALERCIGDNERKDWVHREIVAALQSDCKIIPITDNFQWPKPEQLPEDMRAICNFNSINWIHDYQDACIEKLERFMRGEGSSKNLGPDFSIAMPHGNRYLKTEMVKTHPTYQRTSSDDSNKESDNGSQKDPELC